MAKHWKAFMQRSVEAEAMAAKSAPQNVPVSVQHPQWCTCLQPVDSFYSEQVGAEVCGKCGGVVRDDVAREAK